MDNEETDKLKFEQAGWRAPELPKRTSGQADSSPENESQRETEYLETARRVGDQYVSLISQFTGKEKETPEEISSFKHPVKNKLGRISQRAKDGFESIKVTAEIQGINAKKLLEQVSSFSTPKIASSLEDESQYKLETLSPGVFAVHVKPELYGKLRGGAAGVAIKFKPGEGVSFILLPEYADSETNRKQLEENIPHETHHLVWNFSKGEVITSDEENKDLANAFIMYQDEVMARLCSDGDLAGYTHLQMLDPETRQEFEREHPDIAKQITETMISLNDMLQEIDGIRKLTHIRKEDLIFAVMDATNFEQLRRNLLQVKFIIEKQPKIEPKKTVSTGWDFV